MDEHSENFNKETENTEKLSKRSHRAEEYSNWTKEYAGGYNSRPGEVEVQNLYSSTQITQLNNAMQLCCNVSDYFWDKEQQLINGAVQPQFLTSIYRSIVHTNQT